MVTEDDFTVGGGPTVQYADDVSWSSTLEVHIILLTDVTSITLIKKKSVYMKLIKKIKIYCNICFTHINVKLEKYLAHSVYI